MSNESLTMERKSKKFDLPNEIHPHQILTNCYCKVCDCHMNEQMWVSHITGKRHLKNTQKEPGEMPSEMRAIKVNQPPKLMELIKTCQEPLVGKHITEDLRYMYLKATGFKLKGLNFMTELQRADSILKPTYTCHMCQSYCTWSVVIEHILGTKHRSAFLKVVDPKHYEFIHSLEISKASVEQLIKEAAYEYVKKHGSGTMTVKLEKPKRLSERYSSVRKYYCSRPDEIYNRDKRPVSPPKDFQLSRCRSQQKDTICSPSGSPTYSRHSASSTSPKYPRMLPRYRSPQKYMQHSPRFQRKTYVPPVDEKWRLDGYSSDERSPPNGDCSRIKVSSLSKKEKIELVKNLVNDMIPVDEMEFNSFKDILCIMKQKMRQYEIEKNFSPIATVKEEVRV